MVMAQKWYPVIDYMACAECGVCVNFCPHHVYNKNKRRGFFGAFLVGILGGIFSSSLLYAGFDRTAGYRGRCIHCF